MIVSWSTVGTKSLLEKNFKIIMAYDIVGTMVMWWTYGCIVMTCDVSSILKLVDMCCTFRRPSSNAIPTGLREQRP